MGKFGDGNESESQVQGRNVEHTTSVSSFRSFCGRFPQYLSFKCLLVLVLSLTLFISALFVLISSLSLDSGYDASQSIKLSASTQAYFRLQLPVDQLVPHIRQLEDEIYREIGVPDTKVVIMSIHKSRIPNFAYVVFGFLPHPKGIAIHPVSLSVLKSSLIELFLQESNLTLRSSNFGAPTSFEILEFRGGITVIPRQPAPVSQIVQTLFNFTLNNSIYDVKENLDLFTKQLKTGLHLSFNENVYVQVTNIFGSTIDPPVIVQASVLSEMGSLEPQRLKQLAQTIQNSSYSKNLGLNNTMFGRVKYVSLSSYVSRTLKPNPPTPSPSPEPSLPPCYPSPSHTSAPPSNYDYLAPYPNYGAHKPPVGNLPQSPTSQSPCVSQGASPPLLPHIASSAQPPSGPYHDMSPSFHPFPLRHHMFMQGREKNSGYLLVPLRILSSGISIVAAVHLLLL